MLSEAPTEIYKIQLVGIFLAVAGLLIMPARAYCQGVKEHPKFIGNVIGTYTPSDFSKYWDQVTPENAGKWGLVGITSDTNSWYWAHLDSIYDYAISRGFPFKFHNLIWRQQQPEWMHDLDPAQQKRTVEAWIRMCGERYPKAALVDVVNEPMQKPAFYKDAIGGDGKTGWDWVIWSFEKARRAFPHAKLILNEYNILDNAMNAREFVHIIDLLKARDLIDGIGCQAHRLENVNIDTIKSNLKVVEATGLPVYISEYDVDEANDPAQLAIYKQQFPIFWTDPAVKGITLWGYIQGIIWRTDAYLVRKDGTEETGAEVADEVRQVGIGPVRVEKPHGLLKTSSQRSSPGVADCTLWPLSTHILHYVMQLYFM